MKVLWLTDLHFTHVSRGQIQEFLAKIKAEKPTAITITGDISNGGYLQLHLSLLAELNIPIYFCLGNHDYHLSGFQEIHDKVAAIQDEYPQLLRLGQGEIIKLSESTALIGHEGWGDGRAGSGIDSPVTVKDKFRIRDLVKEKKVDLFKSLNDLGSQSAEYVYRTAKRAFQSFDHLIIATHVPPFHEAYRHNGKLGSADSAPHYVNVAMGVALLQLAEEFPNKTLMVLCGHTHHACDYEAQANLKVRVGAGSYDELQITDTLNIE